MELALQSSNCITHFGLTPSRRNRSPSVDTSIQPRKEHVVNLKQIEYLVAVVKNGSFSLAAKECYVTVQAVSKAIADLERELGLDLFVRESRSVRPTDFGTVFYEKSLEVLRAFNELSSLPGAYLSRATSAPKLRVALYSPPFNNVESVLAMLEQFLGSHIGAQVEMPLVSGIEVLQMLYDHEIDAFASLGEFTGADDVDCVPIGTLPSSIVIAEDHPLTAKRCVTLADIAPYPVIEAFEFDAFNNSVFAAYKAAGLASRVVRIDNSEDYLNVTQQQQGYSFAVSIPTFSVAYPGFVTRPIAAEDVIPTPICLVSPKTGKTKGYLAVESLFKNGLKL